MIAAGCGGGGERGDAGSSDLGALPPAPAAARDLPHGLLLALSPFKIGADGKATAEPDQARLEILVRRAGRWQIETIEDPAANVFHKAMVYGSGEGDVPAGILTLGGSDAALKLWRRGTAGFTATVVWEKDFGGKFSRMRDAEIADLFGDGRPCIAVATHDQGVVAIVTPDGAGGFAVDEIDHQADTFVHEIESGDLDGDGVQEVYATPSEPNRMDGTPQSGKVVRYVPASGGAPVPVVDLGTRHAKEILVDDVDGDGRDELYISVEGETAGTGAAARLVHTVEIRRYDEGVATPVVIARIDDFLCRFLTAGDVDGDGRRELVAAAFKSGLWLLRPGDNPRTDWQVTSIDRDSSGFEHATLLADLDADGTDELYVASDTDGEVRRYVWQDGGFARETIHRRQVPGSVFTWNLMPVPVELIE
jgi:hypothetical protein